MSSNLRRGIRALVVALALPVGGFAALLVSALLTGLVIDLSGIPLSPTTLFGLQFVVGGIAFVLVSTAYLRYRGLTLEYVGIEVPSLRDLLWAGGGYVSAFALLFTTAAILTYFQTTPDTANQAVKAGLENPTLLLWLVPLSLFVVAPAEELLYRGVIQSRLRETFVPFAAIPITAAIFASSHFFALTGGAGDRVLAISILFFPSLVFGIVYEKTGNLVANVLVHGMYNSTLVLLIYAALKIVNASTAPAFL